MGLCIQHLDEKIRPTYDSFAMVATDLMRICRRLDVAAIRIKMQKYQCLRGFMGNELIRLPYFYRQIFVLETYH